MRKWMVAGCVLWIVGLTAFIIGLNLDGYVKEWTIVIGSIVFFAGLGISGAVRMKTQKQTDDERHKEAADH